MVSVIIPSIGRLNFLREALQSVADQTCVERISRVYVSENSASDASRAVCAEFPTLPISYVWRKTKLPPLEHSHLIFKEFLNEEFTSILHDDDYWYDGHLEEGLKALEAQPEASLYADNFFELTNEGLNTQIDSSIIAWACSGFQSLSTLKLTEEAIFVGSLLGVGIHYSGMIMRTAALRDSVYIYHLNNPYDNDRMLVYALSHWGPVLYARRVGVMVRVHENERESAKFEASGECVPYMCQTTRWLVEKRNLPWAEVAARLAKLIGGCPAADAKQKLLEHAFNREWAFPEIARHLDRAKDKNFFAMYDSARTAIAARRRATTSSKPQA